jgi:hypothetical protein
VEQINEHPTNEASDDSFPADNMGSTEDFEKDFVSKEP